MESITDKLKLLDMAKGFVITECEEGRYIVDSMTEDLGAEYDPAYGWSYCITGCYDSGLDWMPINVKELEKLIKFTDFLSGGEAK